MRDSILRMTLATVALGMLSTGVLMAQVVGNSDPILRNSACVGFDCPDNPTFSDTTILMMENNTRIKFDDTSSAAGFPNRDWQLRANDTSSGGANRFTIDDCGATSQGGCGGTTVFSVAAGARANSIFVDSSGRVGFGTSTPVVDLHAKRGNTPTLRLEQDNSSGFTAQTWDIAGNETNFFVRDVTNGSKLPFRIQPNAPSNSIFVKTNGDVGLGTSAPDKALHVRRTSASDTQLLKLSVTGAGAGFLMKNESVANEWEIFGSNAFFINNTANPGIELNIGPTGDVTILGNCADGNGAGGGTDGCDFVFDPAYKLDSIEDHAATMWEKSHLPAVGPTPEGQRIPLNLPGRLFGMLNELEKAHIYIDQLNERLKEKATDVERLSAMMEQKDAQMQEILKRLEKVESAAR